MRRATKAVAEGSECKEILSVRNKQLKSKDSLISISDSMITLLKLSDTLCGTQVKHLEQTNASLEENSRKVRNTNLILTGVVLIESLILLLTIIF